MDLVHFALTSVWIYWSRLKIHVCWWLLVSPRFWNGSRSPMCSLMISKKAWTPTWRRRGSISQGFTASTSSNISNDSFDYHCYIWMSNKNALRHSIFQGLVKCLFQFPPSSSSLSYSKVLLSVKWRAAGDSLTDQRPPVCAAPPKKVLWGNRQTGVHWRYGDHWNDQLRERNCAIQRKDLSNPSQGTELKMFA